jgi:hypothetical protein
MEDQPSAIYIEALSVAIKHTDAVVTDADVANAVT